jgi:hypothetical protein
MPQHAKTLFLISLVFLAFTFTTTTYRYVSTNNVIKNVNNFAVYVIKKAKALFVMSLVYFAYMTLNKSLNTVTNGNENKRLGSVTASFQKKIVEPL